MRNDDDEDAFKTAIKEAAHEWLNEQFASFGRWTAIGIAAAVFFALVKLAILTGEWPK